MPWEGNIVISSGTWDSLRHFESRKLNTAYVNLWSTSSICSQNYFFFLRLLWNWEGRNEFFLLFFPVPWVYVSEIFGLGMEYLQNAITASFAMCYDIKCGNLSLKDWNIACMTLDNSNKHFDFSDSSSMKWRVLFSHLLGLGVYIMWNSISVSNF